MDTKLISYRKKISVERAMLMVPMNVVMMGRVNGNLDSEELSGALKAMMTRHPLLSTRVDMESSGEAWLVANTDAEIDFQEKERMNLEQWREVAAGQCQHPFHMETGPLVRYVVLKDDNGFDLVICAHHVICDGMSLSKLIRDILNYIKTPDRTGLAMVKPAEITSETAQDPPKIKPVQKLVFKIMNGSWRKKGSRFNLSDQRRLGETFWEQHQHMGLKSWGLSAEQTAALVAKCREEGVTVNTAIWTAFLIAQKKIQGDGYAYRNEAGMAVSVRDKMTVSAAEAFGFYASSVTSTLNVDPALSFWDLARQFHSKIRKSMKKKNPFSMLISNELDPSLIDSLYLSKYGICQSDSKLPATLLRKMGWDSLNYGFSITNVGKVDMATTYNSLELDCVYGPVFYSDVNEKTVGVITAGDKLTFSMTYNEDNVSSNDIEEIQKETMKNLSLAT